MSNGRPPFLVFYFFFFFFSPLFSENPKKSNSLPPYHVVQVDEERVLDRHILSPDLDRSPGQLHFFDVLDARKVARKRSERRAGVHD